MERKKVKCTYEISYSTYRVSELFDQILAFRELCGDEDQVFLDATFGVEFGYENDIDGFEIEYKRWETDEELNQRKEAVMEHQRRERLAAEFRKENEYKIYLQLKAKYETKDQEAD